MVLRLSQQVAGEKFPVPARPQKEAWTKHHRAVYTQVMVVRMPRCQFRTYGGKLWDLGYVRSMHLKLSRYETLEARWSYVQDVRIRKFVGSSWATCLPTLLGRSWYTL